MTLVMQGFGLAPVFSAGAGLLKAKVSAGATLTASLSSVSSTAQIRQTSIKAKVVSPLKAKIAATGTVASLGGPIKAKVKC